MVTDGIDDASKRHAGKEKVGLGQGYFTFNVSTECLQRVTDTTHHDATLFYFPQVKIRFQTVSLIYLFVYLFLDSYRKGL